jgi:hypothetical protein
MRARPACVGDTESQKGERTSQVAEGLYPLSMPTERWRWRYKHPGFGRLTADFDHSSLLGLGHVV